jgi:hypothetical protein
MGGNKNSPAPETEVVTLETQDETLISLLVDQNQELKQLVDSHRNFERILDEMNSRPFLSADEDMERKRVQRAKLAGKDKIERILSQHRQ